MNITVEQLEKRLVEVRNEFLLVETQLTDNPEPHAPYWKKLAQLAQTMELLEEEIERRS